MCLSPASSNYIAVGSSDSHIRIYDRRYLSLIDFSVSAASPEEKHTRPVKTFTIPSLEKRHFRVTSISYSADETELLVSYSSDHLYLFDVTAAGIDERQAASASAAVDRLKRRNAGTNKSRTIASSPDGAVTVLSPGFRAASGGGSGGSAGGSDTSPPPVRRLRLRGDWSDTGPEARPEREMAQRVSVGQARPQLQATIMHRMTEVLSRMLADPRTRIGLSSHGNEISQESDLASVMQQIHPQVVASVADEVNRAAMEVDPSTQAVPSTSTAAAAAAAAGSAANDVVQEDEERPTTAAAASTTPAVVASTSSASLAAEIEEEMDLDQEARQFDYMKMKFVGHRNAR